MSDQSLKRTIKALPLNPLAETLSKPRPRFSDYDLDGLPPSRKTLVQAAVLVGVIRHEDSPTILLTKRTEKLKKHRGQIAFPGGKIDSTDKSPVSAAIREAIEEVGIRDEQIDPVGQLPEYQTVTGFSVTPIVALLNPPFQFAAAPEEVEEIFEVPLKFVSQTSNFKKHSLLYEGIKRHYWAVPYKDYYIWGATAAILRELSQRIKI